MKRHRPMKRGKPLKRSANPLRRSAMKRRSAKKEQEIRETSQARRLYLEQHPCCVVCGAPSTEVHEIPRGPSRAIAVRDADCWLAACRTCHEDQLGDYTRWSIDQQVALKCFAVIHAINTSREGRPQTHPSDVIRLLREIDDLRAKSTT